MTNLTPRQIQSMETKKKIQDKALHLFSIKGFDNVTVDEIVRETGTSKGAFYGHFESKDQIFIEKFKEVDNYYINFIKSMPEDLSNREKILKLVDKQMVYIENLGKDLLKVIYTNSISKKPDQTLSNHDRPLYEILESLIKEGQLSGEFSLDNSAIELTMLITRGMRGAIYDWCLFGDEFNLVKEGNKLIVFILDGICR